MKKVLFMLIAALFATGTVSAQYYVGGNIGFTTSKLTISQGSADESYSGSSYKFQPEVGYRLNDKISIGVNLGYSKGISAMGSFSLSDVSGFMRTLVGSVSDIAIEGNAVKKLSGNSSDISLKSFSFSPYVRYTVWDNQHVNFFVDGEFGFYKIKASADITTQDGQDNKTELNEDFKVSTWELGIRPGVSVKLGKEVSVVAKCGFFGYQHMKPKDYDITLSRFGLDVDSNNLVFGILYDF